MSMFELLVVVALAAIATGLFRISSSIDRLAGREDVPVAQPNPTRNS